MKEFLSLTVFAMFTLCACNPTTSKKNNDVYDEDVLSSIIANTDSLKTLDFLLPKVEAIRAAMLLPNPILLCGDSLGVQQKLAQEIAIKDLAFIRYIRNEKNNAAYRNEIFGVFPARESDLAGTNGIVNLADCFRVEMYNYTLNLTTIGTLGEYKLL